MSTEAEDGAAFWREWNERGLAAQRRRWAQDDKAERDAKWMPLKIAGFIVLAVVIPVVATFIRRDPSVTLAPGATASATATRFSSSRHRRRRSGPIGTLIWGMLCSFEHS